MFRLPTRRSAYVPQPHPCAYQAAVGLAEKFAKCHHEWNQYDRFCEKCGLMQWMIDARSPSKGLLHFYLDELVKLRPCISMTGEIPR